MAANPTGQSCANCSFYIESNCKALVPNQAGGAPLWSSPDPDDWCRFWNVWPQTGNPAPAGPPPVIRSGSQVPSGGNEGDFYVQYVLSGSVIVFLQIWQCITPNNWSVTAQIL